MADGSGVVGAVDAVAFETETEPTRADGIALSRLDDFAFAVPSGIDQALHDGAGSRRAGRFRRADRSGENLYYASIFDDRQLTIGNAHYDSACASEAVFLGHRLGRSHQHHARHRG